MRPASVVAIAVLAVASLLFPAPRAASLKSARGGGGGGSKSYAVIFDAGSSGSRVHVFCFDENLNLIHIGEEFELFVQVKPGLSSYAEYPQEAANSLLPLLKKAESVIPTELLQKTPVRVGATAGLRALGTNKSENILHAVRNLIQEKSSLKFQPDWVTVLDGTQEGSFQWVTINYLLGNLGKKYSNTAGVVDLGGGSVQMAYAISKNAAANAPRPPQGEDSYVKKLSLKGAAYDLYVHSYLNYGLLAARVEVLKAGNGNYSNCILKGYQGSYIYGGKVYPASASPAGSTFSKCRRDAIKALKIDEHVCTNMKCTFGGVWNGGGDGQKNLYVASFFFDRAAQAGFVDPNVPSATVRPVDFQDAAKHACNLNVKKAKEIYHRVPDDNIPYLCMDLVYQYSLLVDGFGLTPWQEITLVQKLKYGDAFLEAAWPLGSAIEVASAESFVSNIDSA